MKETLRTEFIRKLNHFVHPAVEVSDPNQLKGRDNALVQLRDAFETNGMNAFVWGARGVGKTSLVHTACEKYQETVQMAAAISCQKNSSHDELLNDIFRRVVNRGKVKISDGEWKARLSMFGISAERQMGGFREQLDISSVNHASDFLSTILPQDKERIRDWVVVIDEFDLLENKATIDFFTSLAKQLSVDKSAVKFVFCGVGSDLNELISSHESVERYLRAIQLPPLLSGHILEIVDYISSNFDIELSNGQRMRIAQIACGYPHFAHLIMNEILRNAFNAGVTSGPISADLFKIGVQNSAASAATRLRSAYDTATKKGSDKYIEVLWAAADGQLLDKQFKNIRDDYRRIMAERSGRADIDEEQNIRNCLNALTKDTYGAVLKRGKVGWYSFADPMFRSYVRLVAHTEGIDLGDESFHR